MTKRRRYHHGESYFVLIGGESCKAQGSPIRSERDSQHTSVPFIGDAYKSLRMAGIPRDRIITICQLQDYRTTLIMGAEGDLVSSKGVSPRFYRKQLEETDLHCQLLLDEGGADYDFEMVNPATVWSVLSGEASRKCPKVVPLNYCSALFFAVYSHGDSHAADASAMMGGKTENHHLNAEWFAHFPYRYPSKRHDLLDFVATENAGGMAPYHLYSTQLRLIFHRLFAANPSRPVVGLLNYCTSGGNLEFMRRPSVVQRLGVDGWPLFLMASSGGSTDSLVAGLWQSVFRLLSSCLHPPATGLQQQYTFESLFEAAVCAYHKENVYDLLNECKERAFSERVWELDFSFQEGNNNKNAVSDPWHAEWNTKCREALRDLQEAYTRGEAFRVLHRDHARGIADGVANHPRRPNHVVVWARGVNNDWRKIPHSRPYRCPITAYRGIHAGCEVDLAAIVVDAFAAIAKPEFVCGRSSGIHQASVSTTML
ncbi:expressed unknown protein [Seminavis robusta]|uniref:Uncharacterized protein n=1 Tax=Seminavis robusta TaxID=568900 RepID=A0A9N8DJ45_9STRA|nr:expressed unknown protein [Seminavis robusta]|eukprot:Sro172_g075890.1 n/a (483) ;mRNA; f:13140-14588